MLEVRATAVAEDGTNGDTVTLTNIDSCRYEPEQPDSPAAALDQQLVVVTTAGDEYRFGLVAHHDDDGNWVTGHVIEILPMPDPTPDEQAASDEQDQALQAGIDEVLAEEQRRAEELRALIIEMADARGWMAAQLLADFAAWRGPDSDIGFNEASFVVLGDYLEHLQRTPVN